MWTYKSESERREISQKKKNAYKSILGPCILAVSLFLIAAIAIKIGIPTAAVPEFHPLSWTKFFEYGLFRAFLFGLFVFLASYIKQFVSKRRIFSSPDTMICLRCEKLKNDDKIYSCDCGGEFVPLDELEWVDDEKGDSENAAE